MPIPIKSVYDSMNESSNNKYVDYSYLSSLGLNSPEPVNKKLVMASNSDAELLFQLWKGSKRTESGLIIDNSIATATDIIRLKSRGLITGGVNEVNFTKRGKIVITTMSLSEPNKFQTNATEKSYKEILASMDKKNKKGYRIPKFATNNSNNIRL